MILIPDKKFWGVTMNNSIYVNMSKILVEISKNCK